MGGGLLRLAVSRTEDRLGGRRDLANPSVGTDGGEGWAEVVGTSRVVVSASTGKVRFGVTADRTAISRVPSASWRPYV